MTKRIRRLFPASKQVTSHPMSSLTNAVVASVKLGSSGVTVAKVSHGLMSLTWRANPVSEEDAFGAIKAGIHALPEGVKAFLNSGEFYATDGGTGNLELLARFFEKYPEYTERVFLSVKGGLNSKYEPDSSPENLEKSISNILRALRGKKHLDLFQCARVDQKIPIEEVMNRLKGYVDEGKFSYVGLSECNAITMTKANQVIPITAVEIEISPLSYEEETKKVIATAQELNIAVLGYSPIAHGFFTSSPVEKPEDLATNDMRRMLTKFKDKEVIAHNRTLVNKFKAIAEKKDIAVAQLSIAWVAALGSHVIPLPGSSSAARTLENLKAGDIELSMEEFRELTRAVEEHDVRGDRGFGLSAEASHFWG